MLINIDDDFELQKIAHCGQCFRAKEIFPAIYRFITGNRVIYISKENPIELNVSCNELEWSDTWTNYFDLGTNYRSIRAEVKGLNEFISTAADFGAGIRILRQAPFETLISFIISQRKSIPSITTSIERIAQRFGKMLETEYETIHAFPTVEELDGIAEDDLKGLGLGYRKKYIIDAINKVERKEIALERLSSVGDDEMIDKLKTIKGVGDKVANCVALFAYHRVDRVPVDVWIARAINEDFNGHNFFRDIKHNAGIVQQYVFYYKRFRNRNQSIV